MDIPQLNGPFAIGCSILVSIFSVTSSGTPIHICCRNELSLICISSLFDGTGERCLKLLYQDLKKNQDLKKKETFTFYFNIFFFFYLTKRRQWDRLFAFESSLSTLKFSFKDTLWDLTISGKINPSLVISSVSLFINRIASSLQFSWILSEKPKHNFTYIFQFILNNILMVCSHVLVPSVLHPLNQYSRTNRCPGPELANPSLLF